MPGPRLSSRQPRPPGLLDAGPLEPDIASFRLHLAAEGKSARTVQGYTSAVLWFAAAWLLPQAGKTSWDQADARDIQEWMVHLLDRYSSAYASIQFRALRQFFKWRAAEDQCPDPMTRLRAPTATVTAVPVFTSGDLRPGTAVLPGPAHTLTVSLVPDGVTTCQVADDWFEDGIQRLERALPPGVHLVCCVTCLFSDYPPGGHGMTGIRCHRGAKEQYLAVRSKADYWPVPVTEEVPETYLCEEYQRRIPGTGYRG